MSHLPENPREFVLDGAVHDGGQTSDELAEREAARLVLIQRFEYVMRVGVSICCNDPESVPPPTDALPDETLTSDRKQLAVNIAELDFGDGSSGAVLLESPVQGPHLTPVHPRLEAQGVQPFRDVSHFRRLLILVFVKVESEI